MDFSQYGGTKGNSINHYLIEFINFILFHQESASRAVLAQLVDFLKAFNRQDHNTLITKLSDLGVPGWLIRLVMAFLEDRSMKVNYKGKHSKMFNIPGGRPQGTLLGLFLFLVLIDDAGFDGQLNNVGNLRTWSFCFLFQVLTYAQLNFTFVGVMLVLKVAHGLSE